MSYFGKVDYSLFQLFKESVSVNFYRAYWEYFAAWARCIALPVHLERDTTESFDAIISNLSLYYSQLMTFYFHLAN